MRELNQCRFCVFLAGAFVLSFFFGGCTEESKSTDKEAAIPSGPVFYPKAPDAPRLQFLVAFTGIDKTPAKKKGFESFILGEESEDEKVNNNIGKPYSAAIWKDYIYVCDVGRGRFVRFNINDERYSTVVEDMRIVKPYNIVIDEEGNKYVTDIRSNAIFVFDESDKMTAILGRDLGITPKDIAIRDGRCYIADSKGNQVVVMNIADGSEITRFGINGDGEGQIKTIAGIALDTDENVYITDMVLARVTKFTKDGIYLKSFGKPNYSIHEFIRPKGIQVDKDNRVWVVDTVTNVGKIYDDQNRLLLYFGLPATGPVGSMSFPSEIVLDYNPDHIARYQKYAVEGAELEFLVLVINQYGNNKISVYGFGSFPE